VIAKDAIAQHAADPGRADFILARVAALHGKMADSEQYFQETLKLSKDPRILAWSHIYLGRVYDIQEKREQAVVEYRAALTVRDGQSDTKLAAERGIKQAYALPPGARKPDDDPDDDETAPVQHDPGGASATKSGDADGDSGKSAPQSAQEPPMANIPPLSSIPGATQATRPH